ncbi:MULTISPECIES: SRPBCC family protein [Nocardia]|uniref:SRPBCC family protein n=1 Tax=Nocardia TaxID=1817 RepID=UPI000D69BEB9|nr:MULTISPECIES: SRPBCC family protein [Nocardia]
MTKTLRDKATGVGKMATETAGRATGAATRAGSTAQKTAETATPTSALQQSVRNLAGTLAERAVSKLSDRVSNTAGRLTEYSDGGEGNLLAAVTGAEKLAGGASPLKAAVSGGVSKLGHSVREKFASVKESLTGGKGKGKGGKKLKLTNIVEYIDVGVPLELAYDQWTQFGDFPKFTKKLEQVEQVSDEKLSWTGKVFWSRRTWESTIVEQVPFERIVWRSKGAKGYIDGAVTFHELTPGLTRILVVLEYHPQGVFEKTANLWRAAGRRCRLELKQFQRQVMTDAVLHSDDIVGWHGEIHDGEVVVDDETARREEAEDSDDERAEEDSADEHAEEDSDDELAEEDSVQEEPEETEEDETDEHVPDRSESDTEEEPAPVRRRPAARRNSTVTRRSRESREVSR